MSGIQALIAVDVQNDFIAGGALAVPQGDKIIPVLNKYITLFQRDHLPVIATRDWHPSVTRHFKQYGGQWPPHCIQNTWGAEFHPDLKLPSDAIIISAGTTEEQEGYSSFEGVDSSGKPLLDVLKMLRVSHLSIGGLATDYCIRMTVLQALEFGFKVDLLGDAVKGIDVHPGDSQEAISEMVRSGAALKNFYSYSIPD